MTHTHIFLFEILAQDVRSHTRKSQIQTATFFRLGSETIRRLANSNSPCRTQTEKTTVAKPPLSLAQHPRQVAFPSLQQPLFASCNVNCANLQQPLLGHQATVGGESVLSTQPHQLGPRGCPESKDVKRWENAVSCSRSKPRFVIEKFHQGQTSPESKRKMPSSGRPNKGNTPHLDASKLHKIANIRGFPKS